MNTVMERMNLAIVTAPDGMTELVRGSDLRLVRQVAAGSLSGCGVELRRD